MFSMKKLLNNIFTLLVILLSMTFSTFCFADLIVPKSSYATLALPVINKDYFAFEFGFLSQKQIASWNYDYRAYVGGTLFQDWEHQVENQRAGGLGFRAGVLLPTQPWVPLLITTTIGFSKTALNRQPFFGSSDNNISKKDMFSFEAGLLYQIDDYFIRAVYQVSNVKYFTRHTILFFGVYY